LAEQTFYFRSVRLGVLTTNALASQIARKFVQLECHSQALLAGHLPVATYLLL
jgi:hypothetical protein